MYAPYNRVSKYVRQKLLELQGEIDKSVIIVGNIHLEVNEKSSGQKINKEGHS